MTATVREVIDETPRVRSLLLDVPDWPGHRAGQHVDVRLTAEDGYQAQRSYSIASAPEAAQVTLTVERIGEGEVSPYLAGEARAGDRFELRGPIGGYFVWTAALGGPLFLVAGGSGVVPLMAMLRHRAAAGRQDAGDLALFFAHAKRHHLSHRAGALAGKDGVKVVHTLTSQQPGRLGPAFPAHRSRHARRRRLSVAGPPAHFRLRADAVGGSRGSSVARHRPRAAFDQDRTIRTDGDMIRETLTPRRAPCRSTAMPPPAACANCSRST